MAATTAAIVAASLIAGATIYNTEQQKKMAKETSDKQDQQMAKNEAEAATQKKNSQAADAATKKRQAAISQQKAAQGTGRDSTILGGASDMAPDLSAVSDVLGATNTGGKSLLGS